MKRNLYFVSDRFKKNVTCTTVNPKLLGYGTKDTHKDEEAIIAGEGELFYFSQKKKTRMSVYGVELGECIATVPLVPWLSE